MKKIYSHTMAICPKCGKNSQARIIEKDEKIYLEKFCKVHRFSYALISSDAKWYRDSRAYVKPRQIPLDIKIKEYKGCPNSCGLCSEHQQHTCLPVIEITNHCELNCPICLKEFKKPYQLTDSQFEKIIDHLFKYEGRIDVINLSGGEPTLHPKLRNFLEIAEHKGITQTTVSTNGLNLLKDKNLRKLFKKTGAIAALQFDGFSPTVYRFLRGQDISSQKLNLIEILEKEQIKYSLVASIATNINDTEITKIVDLFFESKALSLMFQPITFTGKAVNLDENKYRITIPDIVKKIEMSKYVKKGDFNPLPCSHYLCFALSYYLIVEQGNFLSLKEFLGKEKFLDVIANKTLPGLDTNSYALIKERLYEFWSAADSNASNEQILKRMRKILKEMDSLKFSPKKILPLGFESMKAIFIHQFMDSHTLDFGRLIKCCNPYPQVNGHLIPMCAQNVFFQK